MPDTSVMCPNDNNLDNLNSPNQADVESHSSTTTTSATAKAGVEQSMVLNVSHIRSEILHVQKSVEPALLENSQPMTKSASLSSHSSIKEEDVRGPSPYGTRSRNRFGRRLNYAEDVEMDNDTGIRNRHGTSSIGSSPSDVAPIIQTFPGVDMGSTNNLRQIYNANGVYISNATNQDKGLQLPTVNHPAEKKKRKYERHPRKSSPSSDTRLAARDAIPGTSQFFALPSGTPESAPPGKRRKIGEGHVVTQSSTPDHGPVANILKKSSSSHPTKHGLYETCLVTFEKSGALLRNGKLEADDGSTYSVNDHIYLICEPPGDPYYLCRVMEFRHGDPADLTSPIKSMLVNWYFRPKDIGRISSDARFLFASMQSDECPITSLRGKCQIKHRTEIKDLDEFRKQRDAFWFNQLYDRYIHRPYDIVPSSLVINVPENVKKALDERWKFIVVEPSKMKELTSAIKLCKRCLKYCAPNDSVDCGVCRNTYHMNCVQPPLAKKPSRGFAWSCGPCSRAQERKLEQRHTAILSADRDEDLVEDDEDEAGATNPAIKADQPEVLKDVPAAQAEIAQARMWPWRYLGVHCRVEDVLQCDDRAIYPRASSRLGIRHQAVIAAWYGREVTLVKPMEIKKKFAKGASNKKDSKLSKETIAVLEADKMERASRPKWMQDEPEGYIARGEDLPNDDPKCTAQRLFVMPAEPVSKKSGFAAANAPPSSNIEIVDDFMTKARALGMKYGVGKLRYELGFLPDSVDSALDSKKLPTNYLDKALQILSKNSFNSDVALAQLRNALSPKDLGNPELTKEELKKFEDGVAKYGSELRSVRKHVKTLSHAEIVRFYYVWKWTPRGKAIWGRFGGRRGTKRRAEASWTEIADDEDDSAFDNIKCSARKRRFQCKFCLLRSSRQWRRAPNVAPGATVLADPKAGTKDKANQLVVALCQRCAGLWRRYAIQWEDPDEIARSYNQPGGRAWKRKTDEEMLRELVLANEAAHVPTSAVAASVATSIGIPVTIQAPQELKKKVKDRNDQEQTTPLPLIDSKLKKPAIPPPPRPQTPPIIPQQPKMRTLPCAVCRLVEPVDDQLISCKECKLTVHRQCYAIPEHTNANKWVCDTCVNDKNAQLPNISHVSHNYVCVLCPVANREADLIEPPKVSHKKKTDREREKERLEKELAVEMVNNYRKQQVEKGRPVDPREALKRTAGNNWMHVTCAVWTPEIKFADVERMDRAEGVGAVISSKVRLDPVCKLCRESYGSCVSCHQCHATFHVGCAHEANYIFGFDVLPVKGSRKDSVHLVTLGAETGSLTAAIWCREHTPKSIVHDMTELIPETGLNALQIFVRTYKQADPTLTGTARKANLVSATTKAVAEAVGQAPGSRRSSLITHGVVTAARNHGSPPPVPPIKAEVNELPNGHPSDDRQCVGCRSESSFKWYRTSIRHDNSTEVNGAIPNGHMMNGLGTDDSRLQELWQCHKCHMNEKLGIHPKPPVSEEDATFQQPHLQPDLFGPVPVPGSAPPVLWPTNGFPAAIPQMPQAFRNLNSQHLDMYQLNPAQRVKDIEDWKKELHMLTVRLTNRVGKVHVFNGRDFGDVNDDPIPIYHFFMYFARDKLGFDDKKHVIEAEDGHNVNGPAALMQALVGQLMTGRRESHWKVLDIGEAFAAPPRTIGVPFNNRPPPPGGAQPILHPPLPPQQALPRQVSGPAVRQPTQPVRQPTQLAPPPGLAPLPPNMPMTSARAAPYIVQPPVQPLSVLTNHAPTSTSSTSPVGMQSSANRPTTPREQQNVMATGEGLPGSASVSGASSSPNLKNLVH